MAGWFEADAEQLMFWIERELLLGVRDAAQRVSSDRNEALSNGVDIGKSRGHQNRLIN